MQIKQLYYLILFRITESPNYNSIVDPLIFGCAEPQQPRFDTSFLEYLCP